MFTVYEVFEDGKRFPLFECEDRFTCEVWMANHNDCTRALSQRWSWLEMVENIA